MRYLILLFIALNFSISAAADYQWQFTDNYEGERLADKSVISSLDTSCYVAAETVYGSENTRLIKRTTDYGQTWDTLYYSIMDSKFPSPLHFNFNDIDYIDQNNIIAVYGYYNYLRTSDAGKTWIDTTCVEDFPFSAVTHLDSCIFLSGASGSHIATSRDLGRSWELQEISYSIDSISRYDNIVISKPQAYKDTLYLQIYFKEKLSIYNTLGSIIHNLFMRSTNFGQTWETMYFNSGSESSPVFAIDNDYFYSQYTDYSFDTVLVNSPDGNGIDTAYIADPHRQIVKIDKLSGDFTTLADSISLPMYILNSIIVQGNTIAVSSLSESYISTDNGMTWETEKILSPKPNYASLFSISRPTISKGMALGSYCFATLQPATSVIQRQDIIDNISIYPNPANAAVTLNLEFDAKEAGVYSYKLSTIEGRAFTIGSQSFLSSGVNNEELQLGSNLAPGAYFLSIMKDGEVVASEKVIVE